MRWLAVLAVSPMATSLSGCWTNQAIAIDEHDTSTESDSGSDTATSSDTETEAAPGPVVSWVRRQGGVEDDTASAAVFLPDGRVVVATTLTENPTVDGLTPDEGSIMTDGEDGIILVAYSAEDGALLDIGIPAWGPQNAFTDRVRMAADGDGVILALSFTQLSELWGGYLLDPGDDGVGTAVARMDEELYLDWHVHAWAEGGAQAGDIVALPEGGALVALQNYGPGLIEDADTNQFQTDGTEGCNGVLVLLDDEGSFVSQRHVIQGGTITSLAVLPDGDFAMAGFTLPGAVLEPGTENEIDIATAGESDGLLARFSHDWDLVWLRTVTGAGANALSRVVAAADGGLTVSGKIVGHATLEGGEAGDVDLEAIEGSDAFAALFTAAGDATWAVVSESAQSDEAHGLAVTDEMGTMCVGEHLGELSFGDDDPLLAGTAGGKDGYAVLLDAMGSPAAALGIGGPGDDSATDLVTFPGGVVIVGTFRDTAEFGLGLAETLSATASGASSQPDGELTSDGFVMKLEL